VQGLKENTIQLDQQSGFYAGLYDTLRSKLLIEGRRVCSDSQLVEDSIHDIFTYFITNSESFDHVINIESYFVVVLKRKLIKKLSSSYDQVSVDHILESLTEDSQELLLIQEETKLSQSQLISKALDKLPKGESQAIKKRFLKGFSYEEIATQNNSTIRTVYNQIHSGIKKMRSILDK